MTEKSNSRALKTAMENIAESIEAMKQRAKTSSIK